MHQFHSASHSTWHMILHRALVLLFLPVSLFAFLSLLFGFVGGLGIRISGKKGFGNEDKEVRNTREKKGYPPRILPRRAQAKRRIRTKCCDGRFPLTSPSSPSSPSLLISCLLPLRPPRSSRTFFSPPLCAPVSSPLRPVR